MKLKGKRMTVGGVEETMAGKRGQSNESLSSRSSDPEYNCLTTSVFVRYK